MKNQFIRCIVSVSLIAIASTSWSLPRYGDPQAMGALKGQGAGLTSKITFKKLQRAHTLMANNKVDKAISILTKLAKTTGGRPFEQAQVLQNLGLLQAQKEQYKTSIQTLKKALSLKALPYALSLSTMYMVAQLEMAQGQIQNAHASLLNWFAASSQPAPAGYVLYAYIMMDLKKPLEAVKSVELALSKVTKPSSSWVQLAAALNLETKNYKRAVTHLKALIAVEATAKKYWKQLVAAYLSLDQYPQALATMQLAKKMGFITEQSEVLNLTSLFIQQGIPYWGGKLLAEALKKKVVKPSEKTYLALSQCWMMAEEIDRAIEPLKLATKFSKTGKIAARLGQLYMEKEDWKAAQRYLKMALKKGSLTAPERAHLALGIVHFSLLQNQEAERYFKLSLKSKKTKNSAQQWLNHIKELSS